MKKIVVPVSIAAFMVVASCGGGRYADAKKAINTQYKMMDEFTTSIDQAADSGAVVAALKKFQKSEQEAKEEMMAIAEKYPEMKDQANPPEELKAELAKMKEIMPRFIGALMKIGQEYGDNPDVQKVLQEMQAAMVPPGAG